MGVSAMKLLTAIALLCGLLASAQEKTPTWQYLLINTEKTSGLIFYFENATEPEANVTFTVTVDGRAFTKTAALKTDRVHNRDAGIVQFEIRNLDTLNVLRVTVRMGHWSGVYENPRTAVYYPLLEGNL
jgi:hypothetical protein